MANNKILAINDSNSLTPQHLLLLDPAVAEESFNRLDLDRKVQIVLAAPWQKRRDIIMLAENARELVHALPCDELYWTVRQAGVQDSLQLITLTSQEQLQFLFDMDCWRKDSLDPAAISLWYRMLSKCNELKVIEWFHEADEQFLVASFKKLVRVRKIQQDTDISEEYEDMPTATVDGIYFFIFLEKDAYSTVMPLFNSLYLNDRDMFYSLAEGIIWDTAPEVEEAAYAWKKNRLAEYGFPEFEESLAIYQLMSDEELYDLSTVCKTENRSKQHGNTVLQPRYGLSGDDMPRFYMSVLSMIDDAETYEKLQRDTFILANKIIIADALEVQSAEDTSRALKKAAGAIGIALEFLSDSDPCGSLILIDRVAAPTLFRAGISLIMKARKDFSGAGWHIKDRALLESFFGSPNGETLKGISQNRPLLYEGLIYSGATRYRAFMALAELHEVEKTISICRELDNLLFSILGVDPAWLFSDFLMTTACREPCELSLASVLMTMLGRLALSGEARLEALSESEASAFINKVFEENSPGGFILHDSFRKVSHDWLAAAYSGQPPHFLQEYLRSLLQHFEESVSTLAGQKIIEKRYIDKLLFKREVQAGL